MKHLCRTYSILLIFSLSIPLFTLSANGEEKKISTIPLTVKGMICGQCERPVKRAIKNLDGVSGVKVKIDRAKREGNVTVTYDPEKVTPEQVIDAVNKSGYQADLKEESTPGQ